MLPANLNNKRYVKEKDIYSVFIKSMYKALLSSFKPNVIKVTNLTN